LYRLYVLNKTCLGNIALNLLVDKRIVLLVYCLTRSPKLSRIFDRVERKKTRLFSDVFLKKYYSFTAADSEVYGDVFQLIDGFCFIGNQLVTHGLVFVYLSSRHLRTTFGQFSSGVSQHNSNTDKHNGNRRDHGVF